jgi:hypothetical protein
MVVASLLLGVVAALDEELAQPVVAKQVLRATQFGLPGAAHGALREPTFSDARASE